ETWQAQRFFEFFAELLQSFQMIRSRGDFRFCRLEDLLVSLIHQLRDFAADQVTGVGENLHRVSAIFLNGGRHVVLLQKHTPLCTGSFDQIESMIAQPAESVFITALLFRFRHFKPSLFRLDAACRETDPAAPLEPNSLFYNLSNSGSQSDSTVPHITFVTPHKSMSRIPP